MVKQRYLTVLPGGWNFDCPQSSPILVWIVIVIIWDIGPPQYIAIKYVWDWDTIYLEVHTEDITLSRELQRHCASARCHTSNQLLAVIHPSHLFMPNAETSKPWPGSSNTVARPYWSGIHHVWRLPTPYNTQSMCHSVTRWDWYVIALQY